MPAFTDLVYKCSNVEMSPAEDRCRLSIKPENVEWVNNWLEENDVIGEVEKITGTVYIADLRLSEIL